jgi:hypothetical protein
VGEFVEYLRHLLDARGGAAVFDGCVGSGGGDGGAQAAVIAYVRLADRGRFAELLPGGGIGDGVDLPRRERRAAGLLHKTGLVLLTKCFKDSRLQPPLLL